MFMRSLIAAFVLCTSASALEAQILDVGEQARRTTVSRWYGSLNAAVAQPVGEFDDYIGIGGGGSFGIMYRVSPNGPLAIRADAGYIVYGSERTRINPFPRLSANITTTNSILYASIGPQLMVPSGAFRPYIGAAVGFSYFSTQSSLSGVDADEDLLNTRHFDDATPNYSAFGGVYVPLRRGLRPISLDLGARYHRNGEATYLREGSIVDNPDNSITITPIESEANLLSWHLGVTIGF